MITGMADSGNSQENNPDAEVLPNNRVERIDNPEVKRDSPTLAGIDLRSTAQSAVIWNTGFNLFRDLLQFVVMLVLVRLLDASAYGQFSLVTSVVGFLSIFAFNNFIAYTLQVQSEAETHYQEHFTAGAVLQLGMFVIANIVALVLRWIPAYAAAAPLLHVLSFTFLLEWPCELRRKMIERAFDWRRLRLIHAVGLILNAALAIGLALGGAGVYALVIPGLAVTLPFIFDLFVTERWRPAWSWSWEKYRPAWNLGITRIGSGLTVYGKQLLEAAALAGALGFSSLGILTRSIGLAQIFCQKFATQLMYAIYPILTRSTGAAGGRVGVLILQLVAWAVVPIAICFGVLAGPLVQTVYGPKWMPVVPLLPWAMAWGVGASLTHAAYMLLLARQQARRCLIADIVFLVGTAVALAIALPYGTRAYLIGSACVQFVVLALVLHWLSGIGVISRKTLFWAMVPALASSAIAGGVAFAVLGLIRRDPDTISTAAIWGTVFGLFYLIVLRLLFWRQLEDLIHYFPARAFLNRVFFLAPQ
jgi:O-antigen/teichoic acid export membrane protein